MGTVKPMMLLGELRKQNSSANITDHNSTEPQPTTVLSQLVLASSTEKDRIRIRIRIWIDGARVRLVGQKIRSSYVSYYTTKTPLQARPTHARLYKVSIFPPP